MFALRVADQWNHCGNPFSISSEDWLGVLSRMIKRWDLRPPAELWAPIRRGNLEKLTEMNICVCFAGGESASLRKSLLRLRCWLVSAEGSIVDEDWKYGLDTSVSEELYVHVSWWWIGYYCFLLQTWLASMIVDNVVYIYSQLPQKDHARTHIVLTIGLTANMIIQ